MKVQCNIRVEEEEKKRWENQADEEGLDLTGLIRARLSERELKKENRIETLLGYLVDELRMLREAIQVK